MAKVIRLDRVKVVAEMARLDLTGTELAQKAMVGRSAVLNARKGRRIYRTTAQHIAAALDVPLEELLEEGGDCR